MELEPEGGGQGPIDAQLLKTGEKSAVKTALYKRSVSIMPASSVRSPFTHSWIRPPALYRERRRCPTSMRF